MKRFGTVFTAAAIVAVLSMALIAPATARHGNGGGTPPAAPVEVDAMCKERLPDGGGFGWFAVGPGFDGCNRAYRTIVFNGSPVEMCLGGVADQVLYEPSLWGCGMFDLPVVLTGDGSVSVCLSADDRIEAPWSATCVRPAVI